MQSWIAGFLISLISAGVAHGAGSPKLNPEQVADALIAFSISIGKCNKTMTKPDQPMDAVLSRVGYRTADFMPGGRYVKLMDAAANQMAKSIATAGVTVTCLDAVSLVERTFPDAWTAPLQWRAHFLWHVSGVDKLGSDKRFYRRFVQEGEVARNVFVLTCPKGDQQFELEVIPPVAELEHLRALTQGREINTSVALAGRDRSMVKAGQADGIAGWINFKEDELQGIVELISQKDLRISLFETGLEYRFSADTAASERINNIFTVSRSSSENVGGFQTLSFTDVIRDCRGFRSAR
jgi:hypothetical protein